MDNERKKDGQHGPGSALHTSGRPLSRRCGMQVNCFEPLQLSPQQLLYYHLQKVKGVGFWSMLFLKCATKVFSSSQEKKNSCSGA